MGSLTPSRLSSQGRHLREEEKAGLPSSLNLVFGLPIVCGLPHSDRSLQIGARPSSNPPADMLCWGNAKDGQLGVAGETNPTFEPRRCNVFRGRGLRDVACGGVHTLFLLYDGSVYTCGSNSWGQLGHDKPGTSPGKQSSVNTIIASLFLVILIMLSSFSNTLIT